MNVALPSLITNLHASLDEALWVVNSGPVLGGVLTTYLTWRWVFYVNLPIAVAGIVLAYSYVPVHATSLTFAPVLLVAGLGMGAIVAPLATRALQAALRGPAEPGHERRPVRGRQHPCRGHGAGLDRGREL